MNNQNLTALLAIVVMFVWVMAAIYSVLSNQFVPFEVATPVMLIVAGRLFGIQITKGNNDKGAR